MSVAVAAMFFVALLPALGLRAGAGTSAPFCPAGCPPDHICGPAPVTAAPDKNRPTAGVSCRAYTDRECAQKYGNVTVFDRRYERCVWEPPKNATFSPPQASPAVALGGGRCALMRSLQVMLFAMRPGGLRVIPRFGREAMALPLRCGQADLRPWSLDHAAATNFSAVFVTVPPAVGWASPPLDGTRAQRPGVAAMPPLILVTLVVLAVLAAAGVAAVAVLGRIIFFWRREKRPSPLESSRGTWGASGGENMTATAPLLSASLAAAGPPSGSSPTPSGPCRNVESEGDNFPLG